MRKTKQSYYLFKVEVKDINKNTLRTYYVYTIENNVERMKHFVSVQLEEYKSDGSILMLLVYMKTICTKLTLVKEYITQMLIGSIVGICLTKL